MSEKTLNERGRAKIRQLIEASHVTDVIEVCEEHCRAQAAHCATVEGWSAIGAEWTRAAEYLAKAKEEVEV